MKIENKDLFNAFLKFESDAELFSKQVGEFPLWQFSRFLIFLELQKAFLSYDPISTTDFDRSSFSSWRKLFLTALKAPKLKSKGKNDIAFIHHSRRVKNDLNVWEDIYIDHIRKDLEHRSISFEWLSNFGHLTPTSYHVYFFDRLEIFIRFARNLPVPTSKQVKRSIDEIVDSVQLFCESFQVGVDIDRERIGMILTKEYRVLNGLRKGLPSVIKKRFSGIKYLFQVVHYNNNRYLNYFAREALPNLKIIEIQHGTMGTTHISYNFKNKQSLQIFPDKILIWDDFWRSTRFPIHGDGVVTVGCQFLEERKVNVVGQGSGNPMKTVLVVSQGTIGQELFRISAGAAKKLPDLQFIFKPHPAEYRVLEKYSYGLELPANFDVHTDASQSIYGLMGKAYCVVGVYTTVIFEALYFQLPTIVVKLPGWETYEAGTHEMLDFVDSNTEDLAFGIQQLGVKGVGTAIKTRSRSDFKKSIDSLLQEDCNLS